MAAGSSPWISALAADPAADVAEVCARTAVRDAAPITTAALKALWRRTAEDNRKKKLSIVIPPEVWNHIAWPEPFRVGADMPKGALR
jgi:hypothetical protein